MSYTKIKMQALKIDVNPSELHYYSFLVNLDRFSEPLTIIIEIIHLFNFTPDLRRRAGGIKVNFCEAVFCEL